MTQLERRDLLKLLALGAGMGGVVGGANRDSGGGITVPPIAGGGGGGGTRLAHRSGEDYDLDVATALSAVPGTDSDKPHFVFITEGSEKGEYVDVQDSDVPLNLDFDVFELAVADSLADVPERDTPLQVIFIRSGSEKGVHINSEQEPAEAVADAFEVAAAGALGDITEPDKFPDLNWITASGAAKGAHVNTR